MTLYERFGWVIKPETYLDNLDYARLDPPRLDSIPDRKGDHISCAGNVATCFYLLDQKKKSAHYARETVNAILDYFFGKWQEKVPTDLGTFDPGWWRENLHYEWIPLFIEGICWGSALGDWAKVTKIAEYPTLKLLGFPKEDRAYYLLVAFFIRGEQLQESRALAKQIAEGKKQKPKLTMRVLDAIEKRDQQKFQQSLTEYLNYFRKNEFKSKELDKLLCTDGTILLNLGLRNGLAFTPPPNVADQLIRL
jgi:hypothetical protein